MLSQHSNQDRAGEMTDTLRFTYSPCSAATFSASIVFSLVLLQPGGSWLGDCRIFREEVHQEGGPVRHDQGMLFAPKAEQVEHAILEMVMYVVDMKA